MAGPYLLAGSGIQTIATPSALIVTIETFGHRVSQGSANPPNYRNVGLLTPGDADAWFRSEGVNMNPQKIILPPSCTRLGYAMIAGSVVQVAEVATQPVPNSSLSPWDRSPAVVPQSVTAVANGGTGDTVMWSYTVPPGRILAVSKLSAELSRVQAPTAAGSARCYLLLNGGLVCDAILGGSTPGNIARDAADASGLWLPSGTTISAHYFNGDTGGSVWANATVAGTLFNA